jgi:nucleoside-diphosphate-sugar epimerase
MIFVTGANGFVGSALCARLSELKKPVIAALRAERNATQLASLAHVTARSVPDLLTRGVEKDWAEALAGCDVVVHTAARVHVMTGSADDEKLFTQINVNGTMALAQAAVRAGVKRFVYLSTVKVHGERTVVGKPFEANQALRPLGAYALSKYQAEQGLRGLANETGLELVIIRPPLVYGPGASGNLGLLMRWLAKGVPLPVGGMGHNLRSLVGLDNLVDLIVTSIWHKAAANQAFLVSDDHDLSTLELVRLMAQAGRLPARIINVPVPILRGLAALAGKSGYVDRLTESLQVDISPTQSRLGWRAPVSIVQSMARLFEPRA